MRVVIQWVFTRVEATIFCVRNWINIHRTISCTFSLHVSSREELGASTHYWNGRRMNKQHNMKSEKM
ncbi:hypothetical protein LSTR_LSTR011632 [Laodelphax striatellus]|uniref:Uncharacterized protein n=1 Tax=Laodelphax striatellus TaxID=195883 RepID=A0A482X7M9_LAOST|nr:hypothetical protein LSTR_LSTR011632 [Laodelphax striatellus]